MDGEAYFPGSQRTGCQDSAGGAPSSREGLWDLQKDPLCLPAPRVTPNTLKARQAEALVRDTGKA